MSDHFSEFDLPDTDLTRRAHALAFEAETEAFANHSVRTYLFGRAAGENIGFKAGTDYDDELLYLACVLHDMGLTERANGDQRFEVDGADAAAAFLTEQGLAADRVRLVWDAIALHSSMGIAHRMRPEIALTHIGAGIDVVAVEAQRLPEGLADRAYAAFPRLDAGHALTDAIIGQARANPAKAPLGSFPGEILRQVHPDAPTLVWSDLVDAAWPGVG